MISVKPGQEGRGQHGIEKIAIVADPKWELQTLMFAGAGVRTGQVKFFPMTQLGQARVWLV